MNTLTERDVSMTNLAAAATSTSAVQSGKVKLKVRELAKIYGNVTALDHVSLDVQEGEFMTLLGPSGSGKTTLLQLISGLVDPSSGTVIIDGKIARERRSIPAISAWCSRTTPCFRI